MMQRNRRRRCGSCNVSPALCVAFGAGILFALCFSLKLVLLLAAAVLILLGLLAVFQ